MAGRGARDNILMECPGRKHFDVEPGAKGVGRAFCRDRRCRPPGVGTVIHYFDLATGALIETRMFAKRDEAPRTAH